MSPIARQVPHDFNVAPEGGEEEEIIRNLEGISHGVPNYARFDDAPHAYQRHTTGVSNHVHHLLRWLVWAVTCYHERYAE